MDDHSKRQTYLNEIFAKHRHRLKAVVAAVIKDSTESEDVVQEAFEELMDAFDLGLTIEKVGAWLTRVARNKSFDRLRQRKSRDNAHREISALDVGAPARADTTEQWWVREVLASAIEALPAEQRQVFVMYELEGKSFKEITAETSIAMGTLLSRKKYAIEFLRQYLKEIYDEFDE